MRRAMKRRQYSANTARHVRFTDNANNPDSQPNWSTGTKQSFRCLLKHGREVSTALASRLDSTRKSAPDMKGETTGDLPLSGISCHHAGVSRVRREQTLHIYVIAPGGQRGARSTTVYFVSSRRGGAAT